MSAIRMISTGWVLAAVGLGVHPAFAEAQARGRGAADRAETSSGPSITLSVELQTRIRDFYAERPAGSVEALPPGIRRNLARGKPLPPGIARKSAPAELVSRVSVPAGYELIEVGLDVLLVEVATSIVHDVLMDIVR